MVELSSDNVVKVLKDCLFTDEELPGAPEPPTVDQVPEGAVLVEGIVHKFAFNKERLESHREEVREMLLQLPDNFMKSTGGGWSFLNACMDKDGNQWTGLHQVMEELFVLGIGLNLASWMLDREMWKVMPGGVPYVIVEDVEGE